MNASEIKKVFLDNDVPLGRDDIWKIQTTYVIKHSALERLAAKVKVVFDDPVLLTPLAAGVAPTDIAILVRGRRDLGANGLVSEWSIGEVSPSNYRVSGKQAGYPWAMAEKRAKDRVIIKLAGLHGLYSEDEADDFKDASKRTAVEVDDVTSNVEVTSGRAPSGSEPTVSADATNDDPINELSDSQREMVDQINKATEQAHVTAVMQGDWGKAILGTATGPQNFYICAIARKKFKSLAKPKTVEAA